MKKLFKVLVAWVQARVRYEIRRLRVSPITQRYCDKKLLEAANNTTLYSLAKKARKQKVTLHPVDGSRPISTLAYVNAPMKISLGGDASYIMSASGYGRTFPWPDSFVKYLAEAQGKEIEKHMDDTIVQMIADATPEKDRVRFKRFLTVEAIAKCVEKLFNEYGCAYTRNDSDGSHLILITSRGRIENTDKRLLCDEPAWEDEMHYQDYIDRDMYPGEYGRLKLSEGLYVVFVTSLDDKAMNALLLGPDALTVTPLEKNLHAIFRHTPAGEAKMQPRGIDVGYMMQLGAVADTSRCVVLEAERPVEKV